MCVLHWDSHESRSKTDALRRYVLTDTERMEVFQWIDDVIRYANVKPIVGERAKSGIMCYLQNYGLRREWLQALAATCMLFYEKLEDSSVLRLSLDKLQRMCAFQYTISVLRKIETSVVAMHFSAGESDWDD